MKILEYNEVGRLLQAGEVSPAADLFIKKLFSNCEVLANVLKYCVCEFHGMTQQEIREKYLAGSTVSFDAQGLPSERMPESSVRAMAGVEDMTVAGGRVVYDILLQLPSPTAPGWSIGVIVNIEVQNDDHPGYPVEKRMIYYSCQLISGQKRTRFSGSDYGALCKVYSLWIMPNIAAGSAPAIDRYHLERDRLYGPAKPGIPAEYYDLIEGVCFRFNGSTDVENSEILNFFQLLLSNGRKTPEERFNELCTKYGITPNKENLDMCTYSKHLIQQGIEEGREKGRKEGRREGRKEGRKEGRREGALQATLKTQLNTLAAMLKDNLSHETILKYLLIDEKRLQELLDILQRQQSRPDTI